MDVKVVPEDYKSSHKFNQSPLTEALWICSMDSGQDDQAGTVDDIGWHALFHFEQDEDVEIQGGTVANPIVEATVTVPRGSYILMENDQGFVYADSYPFKGAEVEEDWRKVVAAESDLYSYDEDQEIVRW